MEGSATDELFKQLVRMLLVSATRYTPADLESAAIFRPRALTERSFGMLWQDIQGHPNSRLHYRVRREWLQCLAKQVWAFLDTPLFWVRPQQPAPGQALAEPLGRNDTKGDAAPLGLHSEGPLARGCAATKEPVVVWFCLHCARGEGCG